MTDPWIDCATCGNRYGSFLSACPKCGGQKDIVTPQATAKKGHSGRIVIGIGTAIIVIALLFIFAPTLTSMITRQENNPVITILQPQSQEPKTLPREELIQHALDLINKDRASLGLSPVKLSTNQAAQVHAEDVFKTKTISHWMTNGEKPYMTYTRYGGEGSVQQNVAIAGFSADQYAKCRTDILLDCEKIEPLATLDELENEMVYKDSECCSDGHRDNILDPHHTHASIGIAYDEYYLVFVENFENNYGLNVDVNKGQVTISGQLLKGEVQQINIYFDEMPSPAIYEQNKQLLSYTAGEQVATVVKPLPLGYYYEKPPDYTLIQAKRWGQDDSVNIVFDLAPAVKKDGVYTLSAVVKNGEETFAVTSYSIFVQS